MPWRVISTRVSSNNIFDSFSLVENGTATCKYACVVVFCQHIFVSKGSFDDGGASSSSSDDSSSGAGSPRTGSFGFVSKCAGSRSRSTTHGPSEPISTLYSASARFAATPFSSSTSYVAARPVLALTVAAPAFGGRPARWRRVAAVAARPRRRRGAATTRRHLDAATTQRRGDDTMPRRRGDAATSRCLTATRRRGRLGGGNATPRR